MGSVACDADDLPHIGGVRLEALRRPIAANVVQHTRAVLVAGHQQAAGRIHTNGGHRRTLSRTGDRGRCYRVDAAACSQVPESHGFVLCAA